MMMKNGNQSGYMQQARLYSGLQCKVALFLLIGSLLAGCGGGDSDASYNGSNNSNNPDTVNPGTPTGNDTISGSTTLSLCGNSTTVQQLVDKMNAIRSQNRNCGSTFYPAVGALTWNTRLASAAQSHSSDMANRNYFAHEGLDGSTIGSRATTAGYTYRLVGENIAAGYNNIDEVMTGWINSPGHCANMMNANFKEYGMACASNQNSTYKTYWTQEFGARN